MRFESSYKLILFSAFLALSACTNSNSGARADEFILGEKLKDVSQLATRDGEQQSKVAIFHKTTRLIHQFDLNSVSHQRTVSVRYPEMDHSLIYNENGNYIIDFSTKHLSVIDRNGRSTHDPVKFVGTPLSAAFRPSLGLLVIYDSLSAVAILKLSGSGDVESSWVGGPVLGADATIASGDLTEDGRLILALSNDQIAVVDVAQSLSQKAWVFTSFTTPLKQISWIAPVRGQPNQVMVKATDRLALIDLQTKAVASEISTEDESALKLSKIADPHAIVANGDAVKLVYVAGGQIRSKALYKKAYPRFYSSALNLADDTWTYIDGPRDYVYDWKTLRESAAGRSVQRYRFSDLLATHAVVMPDEAQLELTKRSVFALFPSELGYAVDYAIDETSRSEFKLFNLDYIRK